LELLRMYALTEEFLTLNQGRLLWNKYGWLSNPEDLPYAVDWVRSVWHSSTTNHSGSDKHERAAHGSLSPQNPLVNQLELPCFLDSQGFPHPD
jgi:hypothetical protein